MFKLIFEHGNYLPENTNEFSESLQIIDFMTTTVSTVSFYVALGYVADGYVN